MMQAQLSNSSRRSCFLLLGLLVVAACSEQAPVAPLAPESALAARGGGQGPTVRSTDPDSATVDTTLNVHVFGSGFDVGSRADWAFKGVVSDKIVTNSTQFVSANELVANITIARNADLGSHDVIVTTAAGKPGMGTELFVVTLKTTDLGTLGGTTSRARQINNSGDIVGESTLSDGSMRAAYWTRVSANAWTIRQLSASPDEFQSGVGAINDAGVVAGWFYYRSSDGSTQQDPVRWTSSSAAAENLVPLGIDAGGINLAGQIVGEMNVSGIRRGFRWENGVVTDLGGFGGGPSAAWGINSTGVIVGIGRATPQGVFRAVVWRMGVITELPMLPGGTSHAFAHEINDDGVIVGSSPVASGEWHAVRWVPASGEPSGYRIEDLGYPNSIARDINNNGAIVGHYHVHNGVERAFYWHPTRGKMDLPALSGNAYRLAFGINDAGEVVGHGVKNGSSAEHGIVWTGIP